MPERRRIFGVGRDIVVDVMAILSCHAAKVGRFVQDSQAVTSFRNVFRVNVGSRFADVAFWDEGLAKGVLLKNSRHDDMATVMDNAAICGRCESSHTKVGHCRCFL